MNPKLHERRPTNQIPEGFLQTAEQIPDVLEDLAVELSQKDAAHLLVSFMYFGNSEGVLTPDTEDAQS